MLLRQDTLRAIRDGTVSVAFRRWRRPTVKTGGSLLTSVGQLDVHAVEKVAAGRITTSEALAAGFPDLAALHAELAKRPDGDVYRIRLSFAGADPRVALREAVPDTAELAAIVERLDRLDRRSTTGPWTRRCLALIDARPAELSTVLAQACGMERADFKGKIRRLKGLGLTESLEVGYRLSPRGKAVLQQSSL